MTTVLVTDGVRANAGHSSAVPANAGTANAGPRSVADVIAGPRSVADVIAGLHRALDAGSVVDLGAATGPELAEAVVGMREVRARLAALDAAVVGRFATSGEWARDGARSVRSWMRQRTPSGDAEIAERAWLAHWLGSFPHLAARLAAGEVTVEHVRVLAQAHGRYRVLRPVLRAAEEVIADYAVGRPPADLRAFLAELLLRANPDAVDEADESRSRTRVHCHVHELLDGYVHVAALLPPDLGAKFLACLRAAGQASDPAPAADADARSDERPTGVDDANGSAGSSSAVDRPDADPDQGDGGRDGDADGADPDPGLVCDPRPISQRNLDALARLLDSAEAGLGDRRLPGVRGARPVVTVTVDLATMTAARRAGGEPARLGGPGSRATVPVSGETARRIACDAAIRRLVIDPPGQVVDVGRTTRVIGSALRASVAHRDGHRCRWPGCRSPIDEIHHIVHWAHGGPTTRDNTLGLCWWHHHTLHTDGWRVEGDGNGTVTFRRSIGTAVVLTSAPPGGRPPGRQDRAPTGAGSPPDADPIF